MGFRLSTNADNSIIEKGINPKFSPENLKILK